MTSPSDVADRRIVKSLYEQLVPIRALVHLVRNRLIREKGAAGWRSCYFQNYHTSRATTAFFELVEREASRLPEKPVKFLEWLHLHKLEEAGEETMFREDLLTLGYRNEQIDSSLPDEVILDMFGRQMALVVCKHPFALLGFLLVTECLPSNISAVQNEIASLGISPRAISTIRYHAKEDIQHREPIFDLIELYAKDQRIYELVYFAAASTLVGWGLFFDKVISNPKPQAG